MAEMNRALSWRKRRGAIEVRMTTDEAFAILRVEKDLIDNAGPAVLRLALLEVALLQQRRLRDDEVLQAAKTASEELHRLIAERPCVSLIDFRARDIVLSRAGAA
jgi:hypothetical protein